MAPRRHPTSHSTNDAIADEIANEEVNNVEGASETKNLGTVATNPNNTNSAKPTGETVEPNLMQIMRAFFLQMTQEAHVQATPCTTTSGWQWKQ